MPEIVRPPTALAYEGAPITIFTPEATTTESVPKSSTTTLKTAITEALTQEQIKGLVEATFGKNSRMARVIFCESGDVQYKDGKVLTSTTFDYGITQINLRVWGKKAKELGFDIMTIDGNLKMGKYIYDTVGINAWMCSRIVQ